MNVQTFDPKVATTALVASNEKLVANGKEPVDLKDPEDVTMALQNLYDLSDSDADELGQRVWDQVLCSR